MEVGGMADDAQKNHDGEESRQVSTGQDLANDGGCKPQRIIKHRRPRIKTTEGRYLLL